MAPLRGFGKKFSILLIMCTKIFAWHYFYSDFNALLERSIIQNTEVTKYLAFVVENVSRLEAHVEPKSSRKRSLSSMSHEFNSVVGVDHLHLGGLKGFGIMYSVTRDSVGAIAESTAMYEAIFTFESQWVLPCRYPQNILFESAFRKDIFFKLCLKPKYS